MSRHNCPGEECGICRNAIDSIEEERSTGRPYGYTQDEADFMADAAAADAYYGRDQ